MRARSLIVAGTWLLLVGCGGATSGNHGGPAPGGESSAPGGDAPEGGGDAPGADGGGSLGRTISGKVIDGYINGARVYLDLNFNSQWDAGEPEAVTGTAGDYELELPADLSECAAYVPLVVDVPVGAIDADSGRVEAAYQMVRPPRFAPILDDDFHHVSPLTTALWSVVERELESRFDTLTCNVVISDRTLREALLDVLEAAVAQAVRHYNLSEEQIFRDFIAAGDADSAAMARQIVRGLQQSVIDTAALRRANPGAFALVDYHLGDYRDGDWAYPGAWYRETTILFESTSSFELVKMSDDLSQRMRTIIFSERRTEAAPDHDYAIDHEYESRAGDESPYTCNIKESVRTVRDEIEYELVNMTSRDLAAEEECVQGMFGSVITDRYAFINFREPGVTYSSQYYYVRSAAFSFLDDWVGIADRHESLDMDELVRALSALPYTYADDTADPSGATWWVKNRTYSSAGDTISIQKRSDGTYEKRTTHADGTHSLECSTDGTTWSTTTVRCE